MVMILGSAIGKAIYFFSSSGQKLVTCNVTIFSGGTIWQGVGDLCVELLFAIY